MTENIDKKLAEGELSALEYLCLKAQAEYDAALARGDDFLACYEAEMTRWQRAKEAVSSGKKIVLYGGRLPAEVLWASGCEPVSIDYMQLRMGSAVSYTKKAVYAAEKILPDCFCGLVKTMLGTVSTNNLGFEPAAFVYAAVACDASGLGYGYVYRELKIPRYEFDLPNFKGEYARQYTASQIASLREFLAQISGETPDDARLSALFKNTNRCYELLEELASLRALTPCPLPGKMLIRNAWANAEPCLEENIAFLEQELAVARANALAGRGYCPKGEKHRAAFVQNMVWSAEFATDFLEREYGCACVADGIGEQGSLRFADPENLSECELTLAERMLERMGYHGVSWNNFQLSDLVCDTIKKYSADVGIFAGHVGCRHTWMAVNMISETVQTRFGIAPLLLKVDGADRGYKSEADILRELTEYMETVVGE